MKKVFGSSLLVVFLLVSAPGCGDKGPVNVSEDASQSDVDAYLAEQARGEQEAEAGASEINAATN